MAGGGGSRFFGRKTEPQEFRTAIRKAEEQAKDQDFETKVANLLGELLSDFDQRDTNAITKCLDEIKKALESDIEGTVDPVFGGSVRKHTYVDGVSDVDSLIILKDARLRSMTPQQVLDYFEETLRRKVTGWDLSRGQLAITLTRQNLQIQFLPAIKQETGIAIASSAGDQWSKVNPESFFRLLTTINQRNGSKVIPTIKLTKIINESFPESDRLTGYHIESLAIEAFRNYGGLLNPKAMLRHLTENASKRVLTPILDKTGQSVYVDEYLGSANSQKRKTASDNLERVVRRMRNADASRSEDQWLRILGEE
jgi:hypothetical protein